MIYDQTFNLWFQEKKETIQYNAALAITDAIRGSYRKKTIPRTRFGDSSTATLVQKTLLFLQNTKITASEVHLFTYSYTQYVVQNKPML